MGVELKKGDIIDMEFRIVEIKQELANEWFLYTVQRIESGRYYDAVIFVDGTEISMEIVVGVGYRDYERCKYNLLAHYVDCGLAPGFAYFIFDEKKYDSLYEYLSFMAKGIKDNTLYDFYMKEKSSAGKNDINKNTERSEFRKKIEHEIKEGDKDRENEGAKRVNEYIDNVVKNVCNSIKTEIEKKAINKEFQEKERKKYIKGYHEINRSLTMYGVERYISDESKRLYRKHPDVSEHEINDTVYFRISLYCVVESEEAEEIKKIGRKEIARKIMYHRYALSTTGKRLINGISKQFEKDGINISYNFSRRHKENECYFTSTDFKNELRYSDVAYYLNIYYKMEI